ncbi:MAG: HAD-IA family hydrolase [Ilumatobacteraceae bacterium]
MSAATKSSRPVARPAAVLWDMDGTIVDTEPYWIECEYELVAEFGGHWDQEKAHSMVGNDLRVSAAILRDRGGVDLPIDDIVNRLLDGVIERVQRKVPWRPGARDTLAALRVAGIPCALVTMSWKRFADAVVKALPPGTFDVVISGDEVQRGKPHPEPYLAAADALGVRAKDCVAIEDSPTGIRSAVAAGCRTFAIPNVVDIPDGRGYTVVRSLTELDGTQLGLGQQITMARRRKQRLRPLLAVVALGGLGAAAAITLRNADSPPPLKDIPISAWAPYWALPEATESMTAHGQLLHEASPFWFSARGATDIGLDGSTTAEQGPALINAIRTQGVQLLPAIVDGMPKGGMAAVLADPVSRTAHVGAIVALVQQNGYDGIDIDYEGFAFVDDRATWETTRPNWVAFIDELATALHADGKLLAVSIPPIYNGGRDGDSGYWVYDYAGIGDAVDRIRIMAYDYSVSEPGPIAPLDWVRSVVKAAKKAVDDDSKLVLGVPLYGRNWVIATAGTCPADAEGTTPVTQRTVDELAAKRGAQPVQVEGTGESTFEYQLEVSDGVTTCTQTREVHYVDAAGARARVDIAREERIGGVAFWALGFDGEAVWGQVADVARPQADDTVAPTAT